MCKTLKRNPNNTDNKTNLLPILFDQTYFHHCFICKNLSNIAAVLYKYTTCGHFFTPSVPLKLKQL